MNVMKKAWSIAKEAVQKFGGKVKEYFAHSLKLAWSLHKKYEQVKNSNNNVDNLVKHLITKRDSNTQVVEVDELLVAEKVQIEGVELKEICKDGYIAFFSDGFKLPVFKRGKVWFASKGHNKHLEATTLRDATIGFREHYGV